MISRTVASYLLRFDDICPTMKWSNWDEIESILTEHDLKPIIAVIPDNRDSDLHIEPSNPQFWSRVRQWQAAGWTVGMHGFQHTYVTYHPGLYSNRRASEFAGLTAREQREKLLQGLAILRGEGVHSDLWIAPGHSFDRTTVSLLREIGFTSISDGYSILPYTDKYGTFWIPQQLSEGQIISLPGSKPSKPKSKGVWTVCLHPNAWSREDIKLFGQAAKRYRHLFRTTGDVHAAYKGRKLDWRDRIHSAKFETARRLRLMLETRVDLPRERDVSVPVCAGTRQGTD